MAKSKLVKARERIAEIEAGKPGLTATQQARVNAHQIELLMRDPIAFLRRHKIPVDVVAEAIVEHIGGPEMLADYRIAVRGL